jgi:aryl-alcohol dehydrogenase-like predicted oxidoreductase
MTFGTEWGWGSDKAESRKVLDAYLDRGGNSIDTANFYTQGSSERFLGEFLKGRRDNVVLATKYTLNMREDDPNAGGNHRKCLVQSVEASLERLGTDYIDLMWVHAWEFRTPVDEVMRALDDLVRAGKVLYVGVSNAPAWIIAQANMLADGQGWTPFIAAQMQYSLVERSIEREIVPMALDFDIGIMPWSPLAGGILTGKYNRLGKGGKLDETLRDQTQSKELTAEQLRIAEEVQRVGEEVGRTASQVALNWLTNRPGVASPIIGARTLEQLEDNLASVDFELSDELVQRLDDVSAIDLGYPHTFLAGERVQEYISGGADIE